MNKKIAFLIYAWGTTIAYIFLIFWLATVPHLANQNDEFEFLIKTIYRMTLYGLLFILIYRSLISTFRTTVTRLSQWHSKKEKSEDIVFVLIIESLLVVISVLLSLIIAGIDEYLQSFIDGRNAQVEDVLISFMSVLLAAILVYSTPIIGELEVTIKHIFFNATSRKNGIK